MYAVEVRGSNNTIEKILIDKPGHHGLGFRGHNSNFNTLRGSVIRNSRNEKGDRIGVILHTGSLGGVIRGTVIENNEIYDNSQALQAVIISSLSAGSTYPGTIVRNNDMYITPAKYTDCNGNLNPAGNCTVSEALMVFKAAGTSANDMVQITGNRLWGSRKADPNFSSPGGWGHAILIYQYSKYALVQNNIITDVSRGIDFANSTNYSAIGNIVYKSRALVEGTGRASSSIGGSNHEFYRNTYIDIGNWLISGSSNVDLRCNVIINSGPRGGTIGTGTAANYNFYYNTPQFAAPGSNDIIRSTADQSGNTNLTFARKRITAPEQFTIPYGLTTAASPHVNACDPNLGSRIGIGVDDRRW
jgi:hypothetical protein